MKGRKPKPTALRIIEGNREHRTIHAELEPKPASTVPPCPRILKGEARKHWKYLIKHLQAMRTVGQSDQAIIMSAALVYGQVLDVQREIDKGGEPRHITTLRRLLNATTAMLVRYEAELGFNPTARTRIKLDKGETQSRREKLLA